MHMHQLSQQAVVPPSIPSPSQLLPEGLPVYKDMNIGSDMLAGAASLRPAEAGAAADPRAPRLVLKARWSQGPQLSPSQSSGFPSQAFLCFPFVDEPKAKGSSQRFSQVSIKAQSDTEFWRNEPQSPRLLLCCFSPLCPYPRRALLLSLYPFHIKPRRNSSPGQLLWRFQVGWEGRWRDLHLRPGCLDKSEL